MAIGNFSEIDLRLGQACVEAIQPFLLRVVIFLCLLARGGVGKQDQCAQD